MFHRKHNQTAEYANVPAGAVGGTSNYPAGQSAGYGYEAGRDVNVKSGYGSTGNAVPQQSGGYGGGYVQHQQTPVSYGPAGQPVEAYPRKRSNRAANWCAAAFVACWACTWPCHGPCCCGL
ncbi:hypothetical protein M758_3G171300 [Ceratodon purpureus]|nr:hypothetical protein M758_3G171300 [Ceratodon purpureus]